MTCHRHNIYVFSHKAKISDEETRNKMVLVCGQASSKTTWENKFFKNDYF